MKNRGSSEDERKREEEQGKGKGLKKERRSEVIPKREKR